MIKFRMEHLFILGSYWDSQALILPKQSFADVEVSIAPSEDDELLSAFPTGVMCTTTLDVKPTKAIEQWITDTTMPLPGGYHDFAEQQKALLTAAAHRAFSLITWRVGAADYQPEPSTMDFKWSLDGSSWMNVDGHFPMQYMLPKPEPSTVDDDVIESIKDHWIGGHTAPHAHELLREAWSHVDQNPRSAVVIAIASAEAGIKHFSTHLVPDASWLIWELQSPPIMPMLENFLRQLAERDGNRAGVIYSIPEELKKTMQKAVLIRNKIVHGRQHDVDRESANSILWAVNDLLFTLDALLGHSWAESKIRKCTLKALKTHSAKSND